VANETTIDHWRILEIHLKLRRSPKGFEKPCCVSKSSNGLFGALKGKLGLLRDNFGSLTFMGHFKSWVIKKVPFFCGQWSR